jgi:hypothetical protein
MTGSNEPSDNGMIEFPSIREALVRISLGKRATTSSLHPAKLLRFWLWGCDANEVCEHSKCDFHQMHLLGMLCTRVFAESYQETGDEVDSIPVIIDESDIALLQEQCSVFLPHLFTECGPPTSRDLVTTLDSTTTNQIRPSTSVFMVPQKVSLQQLRDLVYAVQTHSGP